MKIAQVICSLGSGGAEKFVTDFSCSLAKRKHVVDVVIIDEFSNDLFEKSMVDNLTNKGVNVFSLGRKPGSGLRGLFVLFRLLRLVRKNNYDLVHSHLELSHRMTAIARIFTGSLKHCITVHSSDERWGILTRFFTRGAHIVCCSDSVRSSNSQLRNNIVINNGISLISSASSKVVREIRNELSVSSSALLVTSVGNLRKPKNYLFSLDVFSHLSQMHVNRDLHFVICGDGDEYTHIKEKANIFGLSNRVHLLGARSDVPLILSASDIFLSTSVIEGLPISVLEAFSVGVPCVLSPIPAHLEISKDVDGCFIPTLLSAESYAREISKALNMGYEKSSLREERLGMLNQYDADSCCDNYLSFFEKVLV